MFLYEKGLHKWSKHGHKKNNSNNDDSDDDNSTSNISITLASFELGSVLGRSK